MTERYDVLILGGGVSGCSTAYFLAANPDFDGTIAVVERDPAYANAPSARATGGVRQQFSTPENIRISQFGAHFVKNIGEYLSVDGETPEVSFREGGYLLLANESNLAIMHDNHAIQREHGAPVEFLSPDALGNRFPWLDTHEIAGGFFGYEDEGWLDPYLLLQAYRAKARSLGVTFLKDKALTITHRGTTVTGATLESGASIAAGFILNAAGASGVVALADTLDVALPIESRKRFTFVFDTQTPPESAPLTILPEGLAFRPEGSSFLANLAPPPEDDPVSFDYDIDYDDFDTRIWPVLASRVPAFEAVKVTGAWCCHYDLNTFDENGIVGRLGPYDNAFVLTGFSGHGLQQSPAMGRATSELIVYGEYRSLDLSRLAYTRIAANEPVLETNCY